MSAQHETSVGVNRPRRPQESVAPSMPAGVVLSGQDVLEALLDAALVFDGDGVIVLANQELCRLLGRPREDIVGRRLREFLPPAIRDAHVQRRQRYTADPTPQPMGAWPMVMLQRPDGAPFPVEFSLAPLPNASTNAGTSPAPGSGLVLLIARAVVPSPTRMGGDQHLMLSEAAARMGSWEEDATTGVILWSQGMYDLLGLTPGSTAPSVGAFLARIDPRDLPSLHERRSRARVEGGQWFTEVRLRPTEPVPAAALPSHGPVPATDGTGPVVTVSILGRVELDDDGRVVASTGTVQDVSARLGLERQLHQSNARLQTAFDAAPVGVALVDARPGHPPRRLAANRALGEITGLTEHELLTLPILDSIDQRDRSAVATRLIQLGSGEVDTVQSIEARITRPDGQERWVSLSGALVRDSTGAPDYVIAHVVDVSQRVRAEREAKAVQDTLRAALDASPDGFAVYLIDQDQDGAARFVLTQINAAGAAMATGDQNLVGLSLEQILDDPEGSGIAGLLRNATSSSGIHRLRTQYATNGWAGVLDAAAVRVDHRHVLTTWRDVSVQVAAENVLIEAYGQAQHAWDTLHLAMDATPDAILLLEVHAAPSGTRGPDTRITINHLNTVAAQQSNWDRDDAIGADLTDVFPHTADDHLRAAIVEVAATGTPQSPRIVVDGAGGPGVAPHAAYEATIASVGENRVIIISRDVTKQETTNRQIDQRRQHAERAAAQDPLTGLPNRAALEQRLRHALMSCGPEQRVAVMFCDLDDFKTVNDTHGHRAGDLLLKSVAARLSEDLGPDQTAARISGDEFVLVLPGLDAHWQPETLLDTLRHRIAQPVDLDATTYTPTLTVGCYLAAPATTAHDRDPSDVLAAADRMMYAAKNTAPPIP